MTGIVSNRGHARIISKESKQTVRTSLSAADADASKRPATPSARENSGAGFADGTNATHHAGGRMTGLGAGLGDRLAALLQRQRLFRGGLDAVAAAAFGLIERGIRRRQQDVEFGAGRSAGDADTDGGLKRRVINNKAGVGERIAHAFRCDQRFLHRTRQQRRKFLAADAAAQIGHAQLIQPPAMVVKREVYERLGGFFAVHYGEDWEMWVRIAAHYEVAYTPEILAEYRMHSNSISHRSFLSIQHVKDMSWVMDAIQKWLPQEKQKELRRQASKHYAEYAMDVANNIWHQTGNRWVTHKLIMETTKMYINREILSKMMKIYTKMLINRR